ncbi:MAG: T9SS type A sorting domain-containing protein [Bacteroidales bacterium]|nr:T9SS type A sorting domain-containing protein [Bacteroidales bacterium]
MKKQILSIVIGTIVLAFLFGTLQAQNITLTFTGRDATSNAYVQLSRVEITDLTQGWTETLTFPDTVAILTVGTGIEENVADATFCLSQNNPNPFNGTTNVNLMVADAGAVTLEIVDGNGKIVGTRHGTSLQPGIHQFRVSLSTAGTYVLSARQNGKTSSIKMVCNGAGNGNSIEYIGSVSQSLQPKNDAKGNINRAFAYGDAMTYKGYAEKFGMEIEGEIKAQTQILSETITLLVDYTTVPNPNDGTPCPDIPTLTDIDGNTYNTVQIGYQCWMKENLRTTKYADNTGIAHGFGSSSTAAYWYYPNNSFSNEATYGLLYNWKAVMRNSSSSSANPSGVQGICPTGWHVPSDAEWKQMEMAVGMSQSDADTDGYRGDIAARLCGNTGWASSSNANAAGNTLATGRNSSGFSALPAGSYTYGRFGYFGNDATFWSATEATEYSSTSAKYRSLNYYYAGVHRGNSSKDNGFSVRCVRD